MSNMSIIKHKYINNKSKYKLPKNKTKTHSLSKPINKKIKYGNKNL